MRQRLWTNLVVAALIAGGCGPEPTAKDDASAARTETLGTVEVSSYPLAFTVERLAGSLLEVRFRASAASDPAYWKPEPDAVTAMQQADLIFINGASYESWLNEVSLPTSRIVDTTAGLSERLIPLTEAMTHSHGLEGEHEHTGTAFTTWLDPTLLAEQASAVAAALSKRWPGQTVLFESRLAGLKRDLEALDETLAQVTSAAADRPVVFSHPVYQYLEKRYGLNGRSLHWEPDAVPDDGMWAELKALLRHHPAGWMVWEGEPLPEVAKRLKELGVESLVVEPCGNRPAEGDFLAAMRRNVEALRRVYVPSAA